MASSASSSMRCGQRGLEPPDLGGHQAFCAIAEAHKQAITGLQIGDAIATQRFHMHEDILRALAACQKTETAHTVEPFDDGDFEPPYGCNLDVRAWRLQFGRMNSRRLVHRDDAQNLEAFWPPLRLTDDMRALGRGRISVAAQHRHMQENVGDRKSGV